MIELNTQEAVASFVHDVMDSGRAHIVTAHKPEDTFVIARQLDADTTGETWNREGKFEQTWSASAGDWLVTAADRDGKALLAPESIEVADRLSYVDETIRRVQAEIDGMESGAFAYTRDGMDEMSWMLTEQLMAREKIMEHVHVNAYPMSHETFQEKYGVENIDERGVVAARSVPQTFIVLDESVGVGDDGIYIFQSWGDGEMLSKGAMLNVTGIDKGDVYGVDPVFFAESYVVDSEQRPQPQRSSVSTGFPSLADLRARAQSERTASVRTPIGGAVADLAHDDAGVEMG